MATRVSKHYTYNPRVQIKDKFDLADVNSNNIVNYMLILKQEDVSSSMIMELFGDFNGKSLVHQYDTFDVPVGAFSYENDKGKIVSNTNQFTTTFGIWIFNIFLINGFGFSKIFDGYINEEINSGLCEDINQKLTYALLENKIDTEKYKKFIVYIDFIMPWETILSPSYSEKLLACTKEINKLKAKLIKENQEAFDKGDVAVVESIEKQLVAFAKEYLKDDPALDPYLSGAAGTFENNFKNMFVMNGIIRDPDPLAKQEYHAASSNFLDGIGAKDYSLLSMSLSGGPYSRSKKTELGGYWEKLIEAAMNTVKLDEPGSDCGSKKYIEVNLTKKMAQLFMYSYMIKANGELEELTSENVDKYIGKTVKFRSVLFCKSKTGVCNCCAGNFFYRRSDNEKTNIGLACSAIATSLKLKSMKSFHDSNISTTEIDPIKAFNI